MVSLNKISRRLSFLCIVFLSIVVYSQSVPQPNQLIAYYPFSGNANDSSGNNYDGILSGGPILTQNRFGNSNSAYSLDGIDDYIYFGNAMYADLPDTDGDGYYEDSFSISIWAKSSVSAEEAFVAFGESSGLYTGMISRIGANISFNSSNWGVSTSTSGKKYDGLWHQYVLVYVAGNSRKIYIDGSLVMNSINSQRRFNFKNYGVSVGKERFTASGTESLDNTYTGSVDDVRIWNVALTNTEVANLYSYEIIPISSAPTSISGTAGICTGDSTTLTSTGGNLTSNGIDIWYAGTCGGEAFSEGWDTQPYATSATTVNSTANGILNVTSTSVNPTINMFGIGSFDPSVYKFINFRYRVASGTAGASQIFFLNGAMTIADGAKYINTPLISDNAWHIATIDMSTHALWATGGNITGWGFDYATGSGATMDIDFIELGTTPIIGTGLSILVTPSVNTTYYVNRKGPNANTACASQLVTVNALPIPTFTAQPGVTTAVNSDVTYITESGQTNYVWTLSGVLNTDYSITSGGTTTDNTIVLKWLTTGSKVVTVNYNNSNNCSATVATSSISTEVLDPIVTKNGENTIIYSNSLNKNGAIGSASRLNSNGKIIVGAGSGLSSAAAGTSAMQIKTDFPSSVDGVYWIDVPGYGPKQTYCLMDSAYDGGGWMLALKATTGTTFNYAASYWTTANTLNPTDVTRNNSDAKYHVMNGFLAKDMMALWPDIPNSAAESGSIDGLIQWSWLQNNFNTGTRITPISFFTTINNSFISDANLYSGKGVRFSGQTQVRFYGFNYTVNATAKVRWGFAWNENSVGLFPSGNQTSNDVSGGIGMGSGYGNYSAGDKINCCLNSTGINRSARVEVYIR